MLTFDEASHSYQWNGKPVPGVTSVLAPLTNFDAVPASVLEAAANFGKAVHMACELDDKGELDEQSLDPALSPYLQGWREFSRDYQVAWDRIEYPMYHETMRYAGTPDRMGLVKGVRAVVDIKSTAALYPTIGPQLAAYSHLEDPSMARYGVRLKPDGTYECQLYRDPTDWPVFASLLTVRNWCARHNINPKF